MVAIEKNPLFQTEYLLALLASIDDSVVATDKNFIIQYWNNKAEKLFGRPGSEAIGKPAGEVLAFIYRDQSKDQARDILLQKGIWKGKLEYKSANATIHLLDASVTVVRDQQNQIIGYVGVHRDITDYNWAQTSLRTFLSFINSTEDYFFVVDRHLRIAFIDEYTNQRLTDIYGFQYELGENVVDKLPEARKTQIQACFEVALAGDKSVYEINITTVKGKNRWLQVSYFPVRNPDGSITHACSMVKDITAQKELDRINQMLYRSRRMFETFMENSPIMAWITNREGRFQYLNPSYLRIFQLTKKVIGQPLETIFESTVVTSLKENNELVYRSGQPVQFTEHITTPDGVAHMYQVIKFPVASDNDQLIGGWAIDVTEENDLRKSLSESLNNLKESETNLKNALLKELHLHDMKTRFVSMASHEFRTPLSTMLSSVYLVEKYAATEQQVNRLKHTGKIKEAIQHMNDLLEDFLTLGKLDEGKTHVHHDNIHLHQLLTDLVEELQPVLKKGQTIVLQYSGDESVTTDKKIIKNILINLLSNAIKFSAGGSPIELTAVSFEKGIHLTVTDQGIGISNEDQTHLFQTFFRGRNAQNIPGTGLGLNIVQRYVTLLQGNIDLRSELGKGTVVSVFLPHKESE